MSSTRFFALAFVGAMLGACAGDPSSIVCPTTGITCPEGTVCAAAQPVCLVSACGNGRSDLGEECDDGNILEGDGCSPTCKHEECGNNTMDPGEACDDGNTDAGDGCSADCRTMEGCGNGTIDFGEDCDDANDDNNDACVKCHNAECGDGYKREGVEECDGDGQGNPNAVGDGCSSVCQLEGCHNGRLDPDEECDDMNVDNTDACVLECKNAICGDGVIRAGVEECDGDVDTDGDGILDDTCSDTCHLLGCGNGIKDPGEQCDDGGTDPGDGCSATCTFENCGNGVVDQGEQCDGDGLGNPGMTATCNADCTTSVCGDGKRNPLATPAEECDNGVGNGDNKDCTTACLINVCGDGKVDQQSPGIEGCDEGPGGNINDGMGCSTTCQLEGCGNGVLDQGETCEDGNTNPNDTCANCQVARCGDGFVQTGVEQCDGSAGTKPAGHTEATCGAPASGAACRWQYCGNGFLEGTEKCDDGNNISGDGCTASCTPEFCGDGTDNNGTTEACDGGPTGSSSCNVNCTAASCGDGVVNTKHSAADTGGLPEQCDDGGHATGDGCSATCQFERCGNGVVDSGEQCDGSAGTKPVGHNEATCGSSGANACRWIYCGNGNLEGSEECDNGTANADTKACTAACKLNVCGDGKQLAGVEGCDNGNTNGANKACTPSCQPNRCGDGYPYTSGAGTEECDDGNSSNTDMCTNTCRQPDCGDGQINGSEVCDDGNTSNNDGCHNNCTVEANWHCTTTEAGWSICERDAACGNGFKGGTEGCDDGGTMAGDGCSATCTVEAGWTCDGLQPSICIRTPDCGDGTLEEGEMCDYGTADNNGVNCENGSPPAFGATNACVACTSSCMVVVSLNLCGDGTINNGEQCDDTALGGGTCMLEGFDNGTLSCSSTCTYDTSTCTYELGVSTSGTGMGTVTSDVGGINCGATCTAQYAANDVVTLTATPTAGSEFTGWTGACTGSGACMVTMSDTKTVDAAFAPLCGNGMIDGTEQCDDMDLGTATCSTATMGAMTTGTLGCQADCTFDTTACTP